jgi:hypothetical protein
MPSAAPKGRGLDLQDRDLHILRGLFEARVMTAEQIAAVSFGGRYEAARKRLAKLKTAGYVGERPRRAYDPAVLFLTRKAFVALCQAGTIADLPHVPWPKLEKRVRVSPLTLQHELDVQDVRGAFYLAAAQAQGLSIAEFSTWPLLYQFRAFTPTGEAVTVKPDGFLRIHQQNTEGQAFEHLFFLEVDRSTEPQQTLTSRATCYRDYYRRGGLAVRRGETPEAFDHFPFRILMIFKSAERRNNTAEKLLSLHPPILTQVWLTTFAEVTANSFGPVWTRPIDYREAMAGSSFADMNNNGTYRRSVVREAFVDERLQKHQLLASMAAQNSVPEIHFS